MENIDNLFLSRLLGSKVGKYEYFSVDNVPTDIGLKIPLR